MEVHAEETLFGHILVVGDEEETLIDVVSISVGGENSAWSRGEVGDGRPCLRVDVFC